jgi:hypothetical protein
MTDAFAPDVPAPTANVVATHPPLPKQISVLITELVDEKTPDLGTIHGVNLVSVQVMAVIADQLAALAATATQTKTVELAPKTINKLSEFFMKTRFGKVADDVHIHETIVETSDFVDQTDTTREGVKIIELDESIQAKPRRRHQHRTVTRSKPHKNKKRK